ncbi:hypothetical protein POTOM_050079 [Populus tomentosa]|uniref:Uncharacterized protein n=1 Tax=Populus tomentosa TaxID=118781 RepID=A0A8X8C1Y1_POPTO|nr:hypothetical protein POTOM_050079 [Populus tomentosa]
MQRQYTSNLVDSEALEARWYCSILNFQLYLAVILLFHLFWEFFEGKTPTHNTIMFSCYLMNTIMVLFFTLAASFTRSVPLVRIVN